MFRVAFERAVDKVAGAKTHGESKREHNAAKEDAKGQSNDVTADLEVFEDHGSGKHEYPPSSRTDSGLRTLSSPSWRACDYADTRTRDYHRPSVNHHFRLPDAA